METTARILPVDEELQDATAADSAISSSDAALSPSPTAVAAALVVGALLFALVLFVNRSRTRHVHAADAADRSSATAEGSAAVAAYESRVSSRSSLYVDNHVAAHDVVLFVDAASRNPTWPHFRMLLRTLLAPLERSGRLALVDLETIAQGTSILNALQQMHTTSVSETATASPLTEFLFVRGALVGDYRRVKALLFADALADALACDGAPCAMDAIRVDRHSSAGFIVLGPRQCVQSITSAERPCPRAFDPLVETRPLDTVAELLHHASDPYVAASAALAPRVPLAERARSPTRRSRLLVCHDMKGGYLDDRFTQVSLLAVALAELQGAAVVGIATDCYGVCAAVAMVHREVQRSTPIDSTSGTSWTCLCTLGTTWCASRRSGGSLLVTATACACSVPSCSKATAAVRSQRSSSRTSRQPRCVQWPRRSIVWLAHRKQASLTDWLGMAYSKAQRSSQRSPTSTALTGTS